MRATSCPKGTYASGTATVCDLCGIGKFNDLTDQTSESSCKSCETGKYFDPTLTGQISNSFCKTCESGKEPTGDQKACVTIGEQANVFTERKNGICTDAACIADTTEVAWRMLGTHSCEVLQSNDKVCTNENDPNHVTVMKNCPATCSKYRGEPCLGGVYIQKQEECEKGARLIGWFTSNTAATTISNNKWYETGKYLHIASRFVSELSNCTTNIFHLFVIN